MIEIKVVLYGNSFVTHYGTHIEAQLNDLKTGQSFVIKYGASQIGSQSAALENEKDSYCQSVTTLYSSEDYETFLAKYTSKFQYNIKYNFCQNNCADAVKFALDELFPEALCEKASYSAYQLLCCAGFIGTFGLVNSFPSVPYCGPITPKDVFKKAQLLGIRHNLSKLFPSTSEVKRYDGKKPGDEKNSTTTKPASKEITNMPDFKR